MACSKRQTAHLPKSQPTPLSESADSTPYTVEYPPSEASFYQLPILAQSQQSTTSVPALGAPGQAWTRWAFWAIQKGSYYLLG